MLRILILAFLLSAVFSIHLSHQNSKGGATWEHFKSNFGQHIVHQEYRRHIFEHNLAKIEAHNADHTQTYKMGVNHFTIYTQKQFEHMFISHFNIVPKQMKLTHLVRRQNKQMHMDINWVTQGKVGPVKNQGSCDAGWAFAAIASIESFYRMKGTSINLSEQQLVDCSGPQGNQGCKGGWPSSGLVYIKSNGITTQAAYPYVARDQTCKNQGGDYKISGFTSLSGCNGLTAGLMTKPLAVSVDATNWSPYRSGVFNNCASNINHHVLAVGIINGNWKLKNSWGTGWGEAGYINLSNGNTCGICNYAGVSPN